MRIIWSVKEASFELEFSTADWKGDLEAAKAAGFKTTGPPAWIWYTTKIKCLGELKKHRTDIAITPQALEQFKIRSEAEEKKKKVVKEATKAKKKARSDRGEDRPKNRYDIPYIKYVSPPPPKELCVFCHDPIYFYEKLEPVGVCIWCEKTILDVQSEDLNAP